MPAKKTSSKAGRAAIDWQEAFLYYAGLPPPQRTYNAVAAQFGVSGRTVERHGLNERWADRAREIDRQALAEAAAAVSRGRADQLANVQKLIEGSLLRYAQQLSDGRIRLSPSDLPRLVKLLNELWADEPEPALPTTPAPTTPVVPVEHMRDVLRGLYESGALDADQPDTDKQDADTKEAA